MYTYYIFVFVFVYVSILFLTTLLSSSKSGSDASIPPSTQVVIKEAIWVILIVESVGYLLICVELLLG